MTPAYIPITGAYKKVHTKPHLAKEPFLNLLEFFREHESNTNGMVVTNTYNSTQPTIYLTDLKSVNEFILKENDCYSRKRFLDIGRSSFFFFEHGELGLKGRAQFSEFFKYSNVKNYLPKIQKVMIQRFGELLELWKDSDLSEWKNVNLYETLDICMDDIVNIVVFGENHQKKIPKILGKSFGLANEQRAKLSANVITCPFHKLSFGLATKMHLTKASREFFKTESAVRKECYGILESRLKSNQKCDEKREPNLIDSMLSELTSVTDNK